MASESISPLYLACLEVQGADHTMWQGGCVHRSGMERLDRHSDVIEEWNGKEKETPRQAVALTISGCSLPVLRNHVDFSWGSISVSA